MITGLNHVTFAVADLGRSFRFYVETLGCKPVARWNKGAYLTAGDTWIALHHDPGSRPSPRSDYSHLAFSCREEDFAGLVAALRAADQPTWSDNRSEGESYYFEDPDGHRLELHVGDLASRLKSMRERPWAEFQFFEES